MNRSPAPSGEGKLPQLLKSDLRGEELHGLAPASRAQRSTLNVTPPAGLLVLLPILGLCVSTFAAVPTLDHFYPVAAQTGTTNSVIAIGKLDPWPPEIWIDAPGIVFQAETNKGKFTVIVDPNAPPGPHLVRAFNHEGASRPRFFLVTPETQTAEKEPNDEFSAPQDIGAPPAVINGRLDKTGDVDSFGVTLSAGQTLVASIEASVLASPLDAVLRLTDSRGVQLAWNHDNGRTLDPFLAFTACETGRHVVQVMGFPYPATSDIRLHGGETCVYRLRLSTAPTLSHTFPLAVQRGASTRLQLAGWNFSASTPRDFTFDGTALGPDASTVTLSVKGIQNALELRAGEGPEILETEPNNTVSQADPLTVPGAVSGCIETAADEDRFAVILEKGEKLHFEAQAASLGFALDPWLKIEDADGKELARNDDSGGPDPKLDWSAPAHGTFIAAIGNVLHRGGSNCLYRLAVSRPKPDFKATLPDHAVTLKAGETNNLKVDVTRLNGFKDTLAVRATELPQGVMATPVEAPEKSGAVTLKFLASTNALPTNAVIHIRVGNDALEHSAKYQLTAATVDNGVPGGFRELVIPETDRIWLTVQPPAADSSTNGPRPKP